MARITAALYHRLRVRLLWAEVLANVRRSSQVMTASPSRTGSGRLALVAMIRLEDRYLIHWLSYHLSVGVDHIYLYINEASSSSLDRVHSILEDSGLASRVSLIHWPDSRFPTRRGSVRNTSRLLPSLQEIAFVHWRLKWRHKFAYMMRIDVDEYVYRADWRSGGCSLVDVLPPGGCVRILGYDFGSSGLATYSAEPVPMRFLRRASDRAHFKSISHVATTREVCNAHVATSVRGSGESWSIVLRINHYRLKTPEEFRANKVRADGYMAGDYALADYQLFDEQMNEVPDTDLRDLLLEALDLDTGLATDSD